MKGRSKPRKHKGKQPKPYWRWQPEKGGGGRWWHPKTLAKVAFVAGSALVLPGIVTSILKMLIPWDDLFGGTGAQNGVRAQPGQSGASGTQDEATQSNPGGVLGFLDNFWDQATDTFDGIWTG